MKHSLIYFFFLFGKPVPGPSHSSPLASCLRISPLQREVRPPAQVSNVDTADEKPAIYTISQWQEKLGAYPWIGCKAGKIGCKICSRIDSMKHHESEQHGRGHGLVVSKEWGQFLIEGSGPTRSAQLSSLRHKISKHAKSDAHQRCVDIDFQSRKKTINKQITAMGVAADETTKRILRTAYFVAKHDRPLTDFEKLIDLQKANGLKMGIILHSRFTALNMINLIAVEMKTRIVSHIQQMSSKLCVLADEATTDGKKAVIIIYIKFCVDVCPQIAVLDLVELTRRDAGSVADTIENSLLRAGFQRKYLEDHWVQFAADGASVMLGKLSGVGIRLKKRYRCIMLWHCLNHRLELAVDDVLKTMNTLNSFRTFMDKLYSHFSQSTKNRQEIEAVAAELNTQLLRIGRILDVRWVSSSLRSVRAVWTAHRALFVYLDAGAEDGTREATQRATMRGLANRLSSKQFVLDLGLMHDALEELSSLSLQLQKRDMTLHKADRACQSTIRIIQSFKDNPGHYSTEALHSIEEGNFRGTGLSNPHHQVAINRLVFLEELSKSMESRLFGSGLDPTPDEMPLSTWETVILSDLNVLVREEWPKPLPTRFGEEEIRRLCLRFRLDALDIIPAFREFVESGGTSSSPALNKLQGLVLTFLISTAECERGLSHMNLICTDLRTSLLVENLCSLLFIGINGPSILEFNADLYAKLWLSSHRSAQDTRSRRRDAVNEDNEHKKIFQTWL